MALTMCTLLSSQGPDAPPTRLHKELRQRGIVFLVSPATRRTEVLWLIPRERAGGVVILSVEVIERKARSELRWRMVPLEAGRLWALAPAAPPHLWGDE